MSEKANLTNKSDWDKNWKNTDFYVIAKDDPIRIVIDKFIPRGEGKRCVEIGCFPGRILAVFGELGYELYGIDFADGVDTILPEWLKKQGYNIGDFKKGDFLEMKLDERFDIVCSFGFIEHFNNWQEVLMRQAQMVNSGGRLIVTAPNFSGLLQGAFLRLIDDENYQKHFIPSINPEQWSKALIADGFAIEYVGYFGKFGYWINNKKLNCFQRAIVYIYEKVIKRILIKFNPGKQTSLYCGVIARKK